MTIAFALRLASIALSGQRAWGVKSDRLLEPQIDAMTMELHYTRHHKSAVDGLNAQIKSYPELANMTIEQALRQVSRYNTAVRNNGGKHYNHEIFWGS